MHQKNLLSQIFNSKILSILEKKLNIYMAYVFLKKIIKFYFQVAGQQSKLKSKINSIKFLIF